MWKIPFAVCQVRSRTDSHDKQKKQARGDRSISKTPSTFSETLNAEVLKKCPNPRDLVLDPTSIGDPVPDHRIRPDGQQVVVRAWTDPERTAAPVAVVLTEFVDPDGIDVYFKVPDLQDTRPIRIMDDELLSEPPKFAV